MTQEIVIKVQAHCDKCMKKAMTLVASAEGVDSVAMHGEDKDQLKVVGDDIDPVDLVKTIRRKVAYADIVSVGEVESDEEESDDEESDNEEPQVDEWTQWNPYYASLKANYASYPSGSVVVYEIPRDSGRGSCSIM